MRARTVPPSRRSLFRRVSSNTDFMRCFCFSITSDTSWSKHAQWQIKTIDLTVDGDTHERFRPQQAQRSWHLAIKTNCWTVYSSEEERGQQRVIVCQGRHINQRARLPAGGWFWPQRSSGCLCCSLCWWTPEGRIWPHCNCWQRVQFSVREIEKDRESLLLLAVSNDLKLLKPVAILLQICSGEMWTNEY